MKKIVCNVKPFNEFSLNSCFKHQLLTVFNGFEIDNKDYFDNLLFAFCLKNKRVISKQINKIKMSDVYKKIGLKVTKRKKVNKCCVEYIIRQLNNQKVVIANLDCKELDYRNDIGLIKPTLHCVLIYGYNNNKELFYVIDHTYTNGYNYKKIRVSYASITKSIKSYVENIQQPKDYLFYIYEKTNAQQTNNQPNELNRKMHKSFILLVNQLKRYKIIMKKEKRLSVFSKEIIDSIINIRQTREFEKYKYYLLKNRRLSNIFDCLVEDYSFVFAVVSKYYITKVYNKFSFKNCIKRIERIIEKEKEIVDEMFKIR